ncbi:TetR/AcrR family transcriptional regulator [Ammoniphilus sp. YIM 78166]|uniref:TetR/AcrR family transcriptional regulator n=1 Tax=Ammoniphilus sp. YIM 78166 TaxID=1644106 RepID=UPI00106F57E2|nr:TetR/AcrR family transcriptional regulator [Ammoniphilus sp. YIM 78166]
MKEYSLREIKKARGKISLLEAGLSLIGENTFREVNLEELCRKAEISKVTFFKFFPQKEDLLVYFMRIWLSQRLLELHLEPRKGVAAIEYLFQSIADGSEERPGLMLSLISFLAEQRMHPHMPTLSEAEIHLFFPGHEDLVHAEPPDLAAFFFHYVEEGKAAHELRTDLTSDEMVNVLFTIFYGAFLTSHLCQTKDIMEMYRLHLKLIKI